MHCTQEDWDYAEPAHNRMDDYMEIQEHVDIVNGLKDEVAFNIERIAFMLTGLIELEKDDMKNRINDILNAVDSNLNIDDYNLLIDRSSEDNPFTKSILKACHV